MNAIFRLFQDPADNVSVTIDPLTQRDYVYPLIDNHPSGSFWYHAHKKGSAWFQVGHLILCNESLCFFFSDYELTKSTIMSICNVFAFSIN